DETLLADGVGSNRSYDGGTIYYHPDYGAFEVNGDILARYLDLGAEQSSLGYPVSDEQDDTTDNATIGRKSEFVNGVITWTTTDGAVEAYYDNSSNTSEEENNNTSEEENNTSEEENSTTEEENTSEEENNTTGEENTTEEENNTTEEETPTEPSEIDTWLSNDYPTRKITVGQALQIVDHLINEPDAQLQINGGAVNQTNVGFPSTGYGGEIVATQGFGQHFRAGVGVQGFNMKDLGFFAPFFGTIGGQAGRFFIHLDPGYAPVSKTITQAGKSVQLQGGFYVGAGVKVDLPFNLYLNAQYSDYPLTYVPGDKTRTSAGVVSLGYRFH
ncbi:MAG: hypothetical protein EOO39_50395, partial [Cytophagaceae bacterium]